MVSTIPKKIYQIFISLPQIRSVVKKKFVFN